MSEQQVFKKAGRKPKNPNDRVVSKGVYLTKKEWRMVEKKYKSGTQAMRQVVIPSI